MKRTQIIDLFANIRATFVSFFSILMFVTLGVAVFLGISWAAPALQNAANTMFDRGSFHNFQIQSFYGLTESDLEKLAQVDGVSQVEAARHSFETIRVDNRKKTIKVQTLGQDVDTPLTVEGELPTKPDEMAFHAESAKQLGVRVGDTITFEAGSDEGDAKSSDAESEDDDGSEFLLRRSFRVTALVDSAEYVALSSGTYGFAMTPSGTIDGLAWVSDGAFDASAFHDGYTMANVRCDSLAGMDTFRDAYKQASKEIEDSIETLGETLALARYEDLRDQAQKQVDDAKKDIADGEKKIQDGEEQIEQAKKDIADGEQRIAAGEQGLAGANPQIPDGQEGLYASQRAADLASARQELEDGKKDLEEKTKELDQAKEDLEQAKSDLASAEVELSDMIERDWSVMARSHNGGVGEISMFSDVTNSLSISMAALFVIVGLLVSYFAVSRIVNEQIMQIGTTKALGFRRHESTAGYICYSGIAVIIGAIIGGAVAYFIVEGIISSVLSDMFMFGGYPPYFGWPLFLVILTLELVLVLGATYLACRRILRRHAIDLLRGPEPPAAKVRFYERWGAWDNLPLLIQTIVNNCMNDKRRVLSTIVGVAGCTALIVTAITLNNDVIKSYYSHYEEVYGFNAIAYVEKEPEVAIEGVESALRQAGAQTAKVFKKRSLLEQPNGESGSMSIVVPEDEEAFKQLYHVLPASEGEPDLSAEGAWVSKAYAEHLGAKVGDVVTIVDDDGKTYEVPILGFQEFGLTFHEMVVSKAYYQGRSMDTTPNALLVQTGDATVEDLEEAIVDIEGFDSIVDDASKQKSEFDMFSSVSGSVVLIYLVLATLMAIVVLLNLNVMFIDEKKRELIVLMINGFGVKDARHYVSYDTVVLTALGVIVGLVLGCVMGAVTVASIEPVVGSFIKSVDPWAVVIGIFGSVILALIMNLIALRRVNNFRLTDINKV